MDDQRGEERERNGRGIGARAVPKDMCLDFHRFVISEDAFSMAGGCILIRVCIPITEILDVSLTLLHTSQNEHHKNSVFVNHFY